MGHAALGVPAVGRLEDLLAGIENRRLTLGLVLDPELDGAERVKVLQLGLRAEFVGADGLDRWVRLDAERALLHLAVAGLDVEQDVAQGFRVEPGFLAALDVGRELGHDLHQRDARAVVVHYRVAEAIDVNGLARVFFEMDARDLDLLERAVRALDLQKSVDPDGRLAVLADLVALGQVGVEVVLAVEDRPQVDRAVEGQRRTNHMLHGFLIEDGKRSGKT